MPSARHPKSSAVTSVVVIVGVFLLLIFAKALLIPLSFALTLSFLLVPAVSWLERKGVSRRIAVVVACGCTCAALVFGVFALSRQVLDVAQTLPKYRANVERRIESLHSSAAGTLRAAIAMIEDVSGNLSMHPASSQPNATPVQLVASKSDQLLATEKLIEDFFQPLGEIGIVVIFTIYMLMNREELRHRLLLLAGMTNINLMTRALEEATERISRYLVMQFQVNACYGILFGAGLFCLQVPEAALWGVIAATLRIVPFIGTLIGMLLPLALSIAVSSSWTTPIGVLVLFIALEATTVNFVEPWLFSSRTGVSSLALLASAVFWSMLWGWPGLVLATPLTVCIVVVGRYVPQLSFLHSLLGTNAKLSPAAHVYERLLAMDQEEATAIAERYLDTKPLVKLYDSVVIPVLSLAEQDRHKGALDAVQSRFVRLSVRDLIARLANSRPTAEEEEERSQRSIMIAAMQTPLQKEFAIICFSAGGQAAELTTQMLTQLLERAGHQTITLRADSISDDILKALAVEKDTVIFISALPPFAFAQTRAICTRVRTHLPHNRIAVALWNSDDDGEDVLERFGTHRPDIVLSTLSAAVRQVGLWQRNTRKM